MLATRLRKVLTAVVVLLLIALASPVLTAGTASAESTDSSGYFTYTSGGTSVTVTGCTELCIAESVSIPSTIEGLPVTSVSPGGFSDKQIAELTIPNSVTSLGGMWYPSFDITRIVFAPNSKITRLDNFQFPDHANLRSIVLPDHLREIGNYAFRSAGLESITIPGTVTTIADNAFKNNRLTSVTIPASVTSLSPYAFDGNVSITYAPPATSSVTYDLDGGSMPGGASLPTQADTLQNTTFTVGNGTEPVKDGYLFGGWSDGSATYGDGAPYSMGGSPVTLTAMWVTVTWTYEISNGAVNVSGCTPSCPDAALTIPSTIEGLPVRSLSYTNFENAPITELRIPSSVSSWSGWSPSVKISRVVFAPNSKMMSINGFTNNGNLRSIVLPDHLRTISSYAFYNAGLDSITIPGTVTSIEGDSFKYNRFTSVTIPASVTSLSPYAFDGNVSITYAPPTTSSVTYDLDGGSMPGGASLPTQADTLQNTTFTVGNGTDPVKDGFEFGGWSDGSATYGDGAPYSMGGSPVTLTAMWVTVTWSYTINNGQVTVSGCTPSCPDAALTIPSTIEGLPVTTLDRTNFENAPIAELRIPSSVSSWSGWSPSVKISRMVFAPNSKMTTINGFVNNGNLRSIVLPDHLRTISSYAFYNAGLDSITIPGTVTSIEGDSFPYNRFTSVTIPASVTSLHPQAFSGNVTKTFADPVVSSVTYDLDGGSMPGGASLPTQADTLENTTFTVGNGTEPVKAGYGFRGWSDYWGTIFDNGDSFLMSGVPETLTAVWDTPSYSVTYALGGGAGTVPTQSSLPEGGSFQVAGGADLSFEGHSFLGWSDGSVTYKAGDLYTVGSSDVTLTALWSVNEAPIPDNVLPPGVDDSMIGEPTNVTLSGSTDTTLTLGSEGTNASVTVPAGALPEGTTLSVYPVLSSAGLADTFPSAHKFVVSMIVTWRAPDGSVPLAGVPVTMTISNPAIKKGDKVYQYFDGVLTFMGKATRAGTITFTFIEDPVFTVSSPPPETDDGGGSGGGDGESGGTDGSTDSSGGGADVIEVAMATNDATLPYTGSTTNSPIGLAAVLFTLGGAMVLAARRKRTDGLDQDEKDRVISQI